jgi:hypothetical protein
VIKDELGAPWYEIYADLTPEPIAAASLGQVYRGRLKTGEEVAVKVQRPGVLVSAGGVAAASPTALLFSPLFLASTFAQCNASRAASVCLFCKQRRLSLGLWWHTHQATLGDTRIHTHSLFPCATLPPQETVTVDLYIIRKLGLALRNFPQVCQWGCFGGGAYHTRTGVCHAQGKVCGGVHEGQGEGCMKHMGCWCRHL